MFNFVNIKLIITFSKKEIIVYAEFLISRFHYKYVTKSLFRQVSHIREKLLP